MSTQSVSSYNSGYDPYLAQRINQAVNAAKAGSVSDSTFTGQTSQSTPKVSQEDLEEYRKQIAEIEKLQNQSQKGMVIDNGGQKLQVQSDGYIATDGCNDGKISFGSKFKNIGKGIVKTFTGMFTDKNGKFSLKKTIKSVVVIAASAVVSYFCPPAGAAMLYAGLALGAAGVVKNGVKAAKAKTDQEAEQAWQGIGTSGTVVAMSVAGLKKKGAMANAENGASKQQGLKGALEGFCKDMKKGIETNNKDIMSAVSDIKARTFVEGVKNNVATKMFNVEDWQALKNLDKTELRNLFCQNVKEQMLERWGGKSKYVENAKKYKDNEIAELKKLAEKEGISTAEKESIQKQIVELQKQKSVYKGSVQLDSRKTKNKNSIEWYNKKLEKLETDLAQLKTQYNKTPNKDIKSSIANKKLEITNTKSMIAEHQNYDAYLNNRILKMAQKNFEYQHPSRMGQIWATTKPTIGLSSNTNIVTAEAITNLTSDAPTLASISSEEASSANIQYQQQLEAQKQALQQQYQVLAQQAQAQTTTTSTEGSANIPQQGYSNNILQNWTNQYKV